MLEEVLNHDCGERVKKLLTLCGALLWLPGTISANEVADQLLAMTEQERQAEMTRRLKTTGIPCDVVVRSMHMDDNSGNTTVWSVECGDKNSYAMVLGPVASH